MLLRYQKIIGAVLVVGSIITAAYFWLESSRESKYLRAGLMQAYELMLIEKNLQSQINLSNTKSNTDSLNERLNSLLVKTDILDSYIRNYPFGHDDDDKFMQQMEAITLAHTMRESLINDYSTLRALINNSFLWLRFQEEKQTISASEALAINQVMDGFYATDLEEYMSAPPSSGDSLIKQHMVLLYDTVIEMNQLYIQLEHSRTDKLIENLVISIQTRLDNQVQLQTLLMWSFITAIVLALLSALILYLLERRRYAETLHLSHELQQFINALDQSNLISKTDLNGNITYANETFCTISGYSREELIGSPHSIVRHPDIHPSLFKKMWETILRGSVYKTVLKNRAKDGTDYHVNTTIIPIKNENNEITEFLAVRHDVTELVKARDDAIAAEHFKDRFLSNMSHELRTPLNGIIGFAQLLERRLVDATQHKYLKSILDSSAHLLSIINDILDLSKIKSGNFSLEPSAVELYPLLLTLLERFEMQAQSKNIAFSYELSISQHERVQADWLRISQIISNLLSNAFKFTAEAGKVVLNASYTDGEFKCSIADSGIGMDEMTIQRIFRPFEQADISITRKYGGTGLGLSITKELLDRMEGTIEVDSRLEEGSRFSFSIPLTPVNATESLPPINEHADTMTPLPLLSGHVLVVEDNEVNQMVITLLLDEFGISYAAANDGLEAVNMFQEGKYDLILMDENMPNLSGIEAMKKIRGLPGGSLPILALTANTMAGDKERFLESGMDGFIAKPVTFDSLKTALIPYLAPQ